MNLTNGWENKPEKPRITKVQTPPVAPVVRPTRFETRRARPDASDIQFTGIVTDERHEPLPGASVRIKGTNITANTSMQGGFIINGKVGDVLTMTYIGYEGKNVTSRQPALGSISLQTVITQPE